MRAISAPLGVSSGGAERCWLGMRSLESFNGQETNGNSNCFMNNFRKKIIIGNLNIFKATRNNLKMLRKATLRLFRNIRLLTSEIEGEESGEAFRGAVIELCTVHH